MITEIYESKTLTKHISCKCKCKFDGRKCNLKQNWYNGKYRWGCENLEKHRVCEKDYIWNPATCSCENGKYIANIIDDSVITCDEIIGETTTTPAKTTSTKTFPTNFNEQSISLFYSRFY